MTHVWVLTDNQVRGVFTTLESAQATFKNQIVKFRPDDIKENTIRVYVYDDVIASYTIARHKIIA
jgi:hypothetical protein